MQLKRNFSPVIPGLAFFLLIIQMACTKIDPTTLGSELIPPVDNISTFDTTLSVVNNNFVGADSLVPRYNPGSDAPIGYISDDPQFGKSQSTLFFELKPTFPFAFRDVRDSVELDSVVLSLGYTTTFGDSTLAQQFDVFELENTLQDSSYRTDINFGYGTQLGSQSFVPQNLKDSIVVRGGKVARQLRISLSSSFGNSLLQQDSTVYRSDSLFKLFFRGFAVVPRQEGNALVYFSLPGSNTYLAIHYRFRNNGVWDTTTAFFGFTSNSNAAVNLQRDYTGSQLASHLTETPEGDELSYIQAAPGTLNLLDLPALQSFRNLKGNVVVHRAELSMQQIYSPGENDELFPAPGNLYLETGDSGLRYIPIFFDLTFPQRQPALDNFGGIRTSKRDQAGNTVSAYNFVITRYVQNLITSNRSLEKLRLWAPYDVFYPQYVAQVAPFALNNLALGRLKLGGGRHPQQPMRLRIIYSRL